MYLILVILLGKVWVILIIMEDYIKSGKPIYTTFDIQTTDDPSLRQRTKTLPSIIEKHCNTTAYFHTHPNINYINAVGGQKYKFNGPSLTDISAIFGYS